MRKDYRRKCDTPSRARRPVAEPLEGRELPATILVNTFADLLDPPPGTVSLRSAISRANTDRQPDTIMLPAGTYGVVRNLRIIPDGRVTIESVGGVATIEEVLNATPQGFPVNNTVFTVERGANVRFEDLVIKGGLANAVGTKKNGGGIINRGNTTLVGCTVQGNVAADGGGVDNEGEMSIQHSAIIANVSTVQGGGIANRGLLTINGSVISNNVSGEGGGGIFNIKTLKVFATKIQSNRAPGFAGGLWNLTGRVVIEDNSRISGNTLNDVLSLNGGGIEISGGSVVGGPAVP